MSINPLPAPAPSWFAPIAVGALATFLLHSLALVLPVLWLGACCCGVTGVPVGFLAAFLAYRQDPAMSPGQGFAVSFIANGIGAIAVAFLATMTQELSLSPEERESSRVRFEEMGYSPDEALQLVEVTEKLIPMVPLLGAGLVIVAGGLTGLVTGLLMRRRAPLPPA